MGCPVLWCTAVLLLSLFDNARTNNASELQNDSYNKFALNLYQALRNNSENIVVSPISLQIILAMAQQGARGATATEMGKALQHTNTNDKILNGYKRLIAQLQSPVLKIATKMFVEQTSRINPNFQSLSLNYFSSEAQGADFTRNPEESRKNINGWVEENTNHKIKDLFPSGSLTSQTKLVIANAVHYKAKWKQQFRAKYTRDGLFYVTPNQTVNVKMMSLSGKSFSYKYSDHLNAQLLELPYEEKEYRMVIILPYSYDGLAITESRMASLDISKELVELYEGDIDVTMPRFKIEETMDMKEILQKLGMKTAFSNQADFSGISNETLKIDAVTQKAFVEVNEEGTEAAAASGIFIVLASLPPQFHCNHPFMYMILKGDTILFIGRVSKPQEEPKDLPVRNRFGYL